MTVAQKKAPDATGRNQALSTIPTHADIDFTKAYSGKDNGYNLYENNFKFKALCGDRELDLSGYFTEADWTEVWSGSGGSSGGDTDDGGITTLSTLALMTVTVTGSMALTKPALDQYKQLISPMLSANLTSQSVTDNWGAMGIWIIGSAGYGQSYEPVFSLVVAPDSYGDPAEQVDMQQGTWTLNIVDPLSFFVGASTGDFKYTKGKNAHKDGWRCDQIALDVCQKYQIPVRTLARGTSHFEITSKLYSQDASPISVIQRAYSLEQQRTGQIYVMKWGLPDENFPLGALDIVPLARNKNMLTMRKQIIDATFERTMNSSFCTVLTGFAKLKQDKGKTKQIKYQYPPTDKVLTNPLVQRFGFIGRRMDAGTVTSHAELEIITKRYMAAMTPPLRYAEIIHPGVPWVHAGDSIRIDVPEEGYAPVTQTAYDIPTLPADVSKNSVSASALTAAQNSDPTLFGLQGHSSSLDLQAGISSSGVSSTTAFTADDVAVLPVPDQSIVFVTSVEHTATPASYQMDIQTTNIDQLDPQNLQTLVDQALRVKKSPKAKKAPTATAAAAGSNVSPTNPIKGNVTMYDSTDASGIPSDCKFFAGYTDGLYSTSYSDIKARFPTAVGQRIVVSASDTGDILDAANGDSDASASSAGAWVRAMLNAGVWKPCIYVNGSAYQTALNSCQAAGLTRDQYRIWYADPGTLDGSGHSVPGSTSAHIVSGSDATQWLWASGYDQSLCLPSFFQ